MKNGVFSCGKSKRLLKRSFIGKRSVNGCENPKHRLFLTLIYSKCTTAKGKLAEKQRHLLKTKYKNAEKTVRKAYKQIDTQGTSKRRKGLHSVSTTGKKATLKSKRVPRKKREQSKCLTIRFAVDIIKPLNTEAYRSGHNEAVLKTVWVKAHGGSNPSSSAKQNGQAKMLVRFVLSTM